MTASGRRLGCTPGLAINIRSMIQFGVLLLSIGRGVEINRIARMDKGS